MPKFDPLLTPAKAAALLKITPGRLSAIASNGGIAHEFTPGGHRRFRRSVIDSMVVAIEMDEIEAEEGLA